MEKTMENLGINGVNSANDVENPWGSLFGNESFEMVGFHIDM